MLADRKGKKGKGAGRGAWSQGNSLGSNLRGGGEGPCWGQALIALARTSCQLQPAAPLPGCHRQPWRVRSNHTCLLLWPSARQLPFCTARGQASVQTDRTGFLTIAPLLPDCGPVAGHWEGRAEADEQAGRMGAHSAPEGGAAGGQGSHGAERSGADASVNVAAAGADPTSGQEAEGGVIGR